MFIISHGNMASDAISFELKEIVSELKRTVLFLKEAGNEFRITVPETAARPTSVDAKYSPINKNSHDYPLKFRF